MSYTWEKTYSAVLTLSGGTGSLQSRLADAYIGALMRLKREDFPAKLREKFDEIEEAYQQVESGPDTAEIGTAAASMNALDEVEARALAEKIVSLYSAVLVLDADNMREVFLPDLV